MHIVTKYDNQHNFHLKNYHLSCKQLTKNFKLSLLYFDFTGAANPVIFFLLIFLNVFRIIGQHILHLLTVKTEIKFLNAERSSFFQWDYQCCYC